MPRDLSALFCPKSVTVIGASRTPQKVGAIVLRNIIDSGFKGPIYPVNPNTENIGDLKCFKDIASLPEIPDLAVVAVPAPLVLQTLQQAGEMGIKNAVVFAAGFKEAGAEGVKLEEDLVSLAQKYNLNVLGPNCLGFVNNVCPINVTFGELVNQPGNLRFISQSGAIAASLFDWCKQIGLGFSDFVTLGNKAVLNENDVLEYLQSSPVPPPQEGLSKVRPIGLYLESIADGGQFLRITGQISKTDPLFIIKPGKTTAAKKAMQSHTGAIAGEDAVLGAVLHQAGVIRCATLEDFFDLSRAFAWENTPIGPKVAVISNAGGPAVISADAVISEGLQLSEFDDQTKRQLEEVLPRFASLLNPVDVLGDALADRYAKAAEILLQNDQVQTLIVILTPQIMTQIPQTAEYIGNLSRKYQKPILCSFIGGSLVGEGEQKLNEYKIPSFHFPERAITSVGSMWKFKSRQLRSSPPPEETVEVSFNLEKVQQIIKQAVSAGQKTLDNFQANELLAASGIPTPVTDVITDLVQAKNFTSHWGWPVVLKLSSPGLLHKKEVGGVITDIMNDDQLEAAWDTLERKISQLPPEIQKQVKVQIQKDILAGVEVIMGVKHDPTFGSVMLFGAGGSLAELISDRNLKLLPISFAEAKEFVIGSKIYKVLSGHGTETPMALGKLYEMIYRLGKLAENLPEVDQIEVNPVIVTLNDAWAVDGKVVLKQGDQPEVSGPQFHLARTLSRSILAGKFHYFQFETEKPLVFEPGQYISVKVAQNRINSYSIAGKSGDNQFNLLVDTSPGGPGSKFFESLKVNDKITFLGPFGTFTLKLDDGASQLLFLGTGSGFAPLKCMIETILREKQLSIPIMLYLGFVSPENVFWLDYFKELHQQYPNFNYKISVDKPDASWKGEVGFITELVKKDFPDASGCAVYLCGNKYMIAGAMEVLQAHGCSKERLYTEKF